MRIWILLLLLVFGCVSETQEETQVKEQTGEEPFVIIDRTGEQEEEPSEVPGIIEVPDQEEIIEKKKGTPATSQNDCATLSPNCEICVSQPGCNWCKTSNACFYEGIIPTISSCNPNDWAKTEQECQGPPGGASCEEQTNCAACLSGSGCKWCIDGSKCASADSAEKCATGGWMTESFQCNYASR